MKACDQCGQEFAPRPGGKLHRFCSPECRYQAQLLRNKRPRPASADCVGCGQTFAPRKGGGKLQTWCSHDCKAEQRGAPMRAKTCSECGIGFEAPRSFQLTCGDACSLTRKRRMKREGYHHNTPHRRMQIAAISAARRQRVKNAPPVYQSCAVCKARFQRRRHNQKTCGPDCSKVYVRRQNTLYQRSVKAGIRAAKAEMLRAARKALAEGVIPRECLWCGDDFDAIDEAEQHCSEDCQVEDACERMKEAR